MRFLLGIVFSFLSSLALAEEPATVIFSDGEFTQNPLSVEKSADPADRRKIQAVLLKTQLGKKWNEETSCYEFRRTDRKPLYDNIFTCLSLRDVWRDGEHYLVLLTGNSLADDDSVNDCHTCPGALMFFELSEKFDGALSIDAQSPVAVFGSFGQPPGLVRPLKKAADRGHFWFVSGGFTSNGYSHETLAVLGRSNGHILVRGSFSVYEDNFGLCDDEDPDRRCQSETKSLSISQASKKGIFPDILLMPSVTSFKNEKPTGRSQGKTARYFYDPEIEAYVMP